VRDRALEQSRIRNPVVGSDRALTTVANHEYWLEFTLVGVLRESALR